MSQDESIQTLHIHQFVGITAKMGNNFIVGDAVVGKILNEIKRIRIVLEVLHRSSEQVTNVGIA